MGLLQEIQAGSVNPDIALAKVLRQCLILAYKLNHEPFRQWIEYELNGYPNVDLLPEYRRFVGSPRATVRGFNYHATDVLVPKSAIPSELMDLATHINIFQGVGHFTNLDPEQQLGFYWTPELVQLIESRLKSDGRLLEVKVMLPRNIIDGMFDIIRNSILEFVLKIEAENPLAGEVPSGDQPIPLDRVTTIFLTTVQGGTALVGSDQTQYQIKDSALGVLNSGEIKDVASLRADADRSTNRRGRSWRRGKR